MALEPYDEALTHAVELLSGATGVLITAGAGMSCDSGLPDYRGEGGLWRKCSTTGIEYSVLAERGQFFAAPRRAWGYHGSSVQRYDAAIPHDGYESLRRIATSLPDGYRVFTSNVDGLFEKAGFRPDWIAECHGALRRLQCLDVNCDGTGSIYDWTIRIDPATLEWQGDLPRCHCGNLLRPNVLLFNDGPNWRGERYHAQDHSVWDWLRSVKRPVILEVGSGGGVPTVRFFGKRAADEFGAPLIRVNLRSPWASGDGNVGVQGSAEKSLSDLERLLTSARAAAS